MNVRFALDFVENDDVLRTAFALVVAATFGLTARASDACVIITPQVALPTLRDAPLNTHVWLQSLPLPLYSGATFAIVRSEARTQPLVLDLRSWEESSQTWELVPHEPLAPGARYEVWGLPRSRREPVLVSTFRTSDRIDTTPPSPPSIRRVMRYPTAMGCPPYLAIDGNAGEDDSGDVLHALWVAKRNERIAYDEPPALVFVWPKKTLSSPRPEAEILHGHRAAVDGEKIGLRTVDLAGHMSTAVEALIPGR